MITIADARVNAAQFIETGKPGDSIDDMLVFEDSSIQITGREFEQGSSTISIVGGTGKYSGISGEMKSSNNNDGTFTQILCYWIR